MSRIEVESGDLLNYPVQAVDEQDHVGGLRGRRGAACPHRGARSAAASAGAALNGLRGSSGRRSGR